MGFVSSDATTVSTTLGSSFLMLGLIAPEARTTTDRRQDATAGRAGMGIREVEDSMAVIVDRAEDHSSGRISN
jgi:hypothetical protein